LLSFVLGQLVAWIYTWTHRGMTWSRNMIHSIVMLSMIVTMVMMVVGDSIARAFGLVGALAIIRFRTVVRDARDTTFIFLALANGIAIGAGFPAAAVVGVSVIGLVAVMLNWTGFGARYVDNGVLRVRTSVPVSRLDALLSEWCTSFNLLKQKAVRSEREGGEGEFEYSYEVRLYDAEEQEDLQAAVRALGPVSQVSLTLEEQAEEW
jgi:uncharacterized membrane protein YhiD involved in acid resistance